MESHLSVIYTKKKNQNKQKTPPKNRASIFLG